MSEFVSSWHCLCRTPEARWANAPYSVMFSIVPVTPSENGAGS